MNDNAAIAAALVVAGGTFVALVARFRIRGFWSDTDGISVMELAAIVALPLWVFVGIKLALSWDLRPAQVDFFTALTYPVLLILAPQLAQTFGFQGFGRKTTITPAVYSGPPDIEPMEGGSQYGQSDRI